MKFSKGAISALLILLTITLIIVGGVSYVDAVRDSLWDKAVVDILEVITHGGHALDTYLEKDSESVRWLAYQLSLVDSDDAYTIQSVLDLVAPLSGSFLCANLDGGNLYVTAAEVGLQLSETQLDAFQNLEGSGIRDPFLNDYSGVWTLGYYERFTFADGNPGYVQRSLPLTSVSERFSLSFYDNYGFSYVVGNDGDILIRTQHPSSNRTFKNLFDIIDLQGNDPDTVSEFREAISMSYRGVAQFQYKGEEYVFCYVPPCQQF